MSYFLYAETAFHHEGDYAYLMSLIDTAAEVECHGIKFQLLLDQDEFMSPFHPSFQQTKDLLFTREQWKEIISYSYEKGLKIVAMPCDVAAVNLLESLPFAIQYYDIHSVSFHDHKLLSAVKDTGRDVILGVGGRELVEIIHAYDFFGSQLSALMVGYQSYPSDLKNVMLGKIRLLKKRFPDVVIGYADHTTPHSEYAVKSLEYAYLLGARVFEKHLSLNEESKRIDYEAAVGKDTFKKIKDNLDYLTELIPEEKSTHFLMSQEEIIYRKRQKVLVASMNLKAGTKLTAFNTTLKMAGTLEGYTHIKEIEESTLKVDLAKNQPITKESLQ